MEKFRIHCKVHDHQKRVVRVGIGDKQFEKDDIWRWIKSNTYGFYTIEKGYEAEVIAAERDGRKYLTTAPDKITDNNLDELKECQ